MKFMKKKLNDHTIKPITFTQNALNHFKKYLEKQGGIGIKISVKSSGCSGLSYSIETIYNNLVLDNFIKLEEQGILFFIDSEALKYIKGMNIDQTEKKLGISKIIYNNPNELARCGCGESFSI